jgi:DNA polymerase-1
MRDKVVLIDGNSLLYRAFFAMPHFSTLQNQPTNAVYGFTMMLLRVMDDIKPDIIVVTFDAHAKTFRHDAYNEYKAHRKPMPDDLISQGPLVREMVRAFNIPIYEIEGFEADDVVGTLAKKAENENFDVIIVTGDLDELQLVTDSIKVLTTIKGVTDTVLYDKDAVFNRYKLTPEQLPDFKGLKGDPSDNIPGVAGIGDKTAQKLISEFNSLENLYENIDNIKGKRIKNLLIDSKDIAMLSKNLATIVIDVPLEINFNECKYNKPDNTALMEMFKKLEFKSLISRFTNAAEQKPVLEQMELFSPTPAKPKLNTEYKHISTIDELNSLIDQINQSSAIAFTSIAGANNSTDSIIQAAISLDNGNAFYININDSIDLNTLKPIMESTEIQKITYDLKSETKIFAKHNIEIAGSNFDIMIASYLLNPSRSSYKLEDIAYDYLQVEFESEPEANAVKELINKSDAIFRLKPILEEKLKDNGLIDLFTNIEMPLVPVLAQMEMTGVNVDMDWLNNLSALLSQKIEDIQQSIYTIAGTEFNIGSTKQLQHILFEKLGLPSTKKTKTGYSTDADTLKSLSPFSEIIPLILEYRELTKLKSTYADSLPKLVNSDTRRIHTSLNQTVTTTGRLSSSDPNLQNIPIKTEAGREIRKAFIASQGNVLVSADYSQIELRILAHVSHDLELINAFSNNIDIHTRTASTLFNVPKEKVTSDMRRQAKTVNFAVIYGMSDYGLSRELGIPIGIAKSYIESYFKQYPGVKWYETQTLEFARKCGYVESLLGRKRYMNEINSQNRQIRELAERAAVNMPIQGTAADIIKIAMINIQQKLIMHGFKAKMLLQVHDELLFDVPNDELTKIIPLIKDSMINAYKLDVPIEIEVKVGNDWCTAVPISADENTANT